MNHRLSAASAALVLALGMTACQSAPPSTVTTVATMPEQTQSSLTGVAVQGSEELATLLEQIEDNVFPGTAGCTLTAVRYTVSLLDWCKAAGVSDSGLRSIVSDWMRDKDPAELSRQFELILNTYQQLMGSGAQELLDAAGVTTDSFPWPESCRQVMWTILEVTGAVERSNAAALESILERVHYDWAGNQADAIRQAAALLDWAANTPDTEASIRTTVTTWMSQFGNDQQNAFAVELARTSAYCQRLLTDERPSLMEKADLGNRTWPDTVMETVRILLDAAGANGDTGLLGLLNRICDSEEDENLYLAVELLDWAQATGLTDDELRSLGNSWSYSLSSGRFSLYEDRMNSVCALCASLVNEDSASLLESVGLDPRSWDQSALNRIACFRTA